MTFGASFNRLVDTPRLYGHNWDAEFGDGFNPDIAGLAYPLLRKDRFVGAFSGGTINEASIDGERAGVLAMEQVKGSIGPSITDGRTAVAADEVVLAPKTLDRIGARVGDVVTVAVGKRSARARVVGAGVVADVQGAHGLLGRSAVMTLDGYRRLVPNAPRNYFLVRFAPGVDRRKALASLQEAEPLTGTKPIDVANYGRVDSMPILIGGLFGLIAIATLVHTLMTSLRRRRRDLAILKTLGFERAQVSRVVTWQATTIVSIAVVIGIPLGVGGRSLGLAPLRRSARRRARRASADRRDPATGPGGPADREPVRGAACAPRGEDAARGRAAGRVKPGVGLEPTTPSLPWNFGLHEVARRRLSCTQNSRSTDNHG